ncbi:MAG TPA: histidine kinase [Lacibacter sp.]|nr:histidine kinase [Lacibacter sp.]
MYSRLFILFFFFHHAFINAQTHSIDSMRKRLPSLVGTARIECLNRLGEQFCYHWIHADSALHYSGLAFQQASSFGYKKGVSEALILEAAVYGKLLGQPQEMLIKSKKAIEAIRGTNDQRTLSVAYRSFALSLALLGDYIGSVDTAITAYQIAVKANDKQLKGWAAETIGFVYTKKGEYWKAFEYLIEAQKTGKETGDSLLTSMSTAFIARSFNRVGDPKKALEYYYEFLRYATAFVLLWPHLEDIAYAHLQLKQYDSVLYYQHRHRQNIEALTTDHVVRKKFVSSLWGFSTDIQLVQKKYDSVLMQILPGLELQRQNKDVVPLMYSLLVTGKAYLGKQNHSASLRYMRELYQRAGGIENRQFLKDAAQQLTIIFEQLKQSDSAFFYYKRYSSLKDSMETAQYAGRTALYLVASEADSKIRLLQKNEALQQQRLILNKKEIQKQVQLKNILIIGFIMAIMFSMMIGSNLILKRKNEKLRNDQEQSALRQKTLELEMQALRAQMNPHFIFNCLSAIDNLIQTNQPDKATTCLSRFAKLVRGVLDSSKNNLVPFEKDFETMKLYLEMEKFRCNNKFNFELQADEELLHGDFKVPPLIIQPFIENAIHHGLLNKMDCNRQLMINAHLEDEHIIYSITDNGIGRKKAYAIKQMNKPDQQSYGLEITRERIQLHNRNVMETDLVISDLEEAGMPAGTKAVVRINCSF